MSGRDQPTAAAGALQAGAAHQPLDLAPGHRPALDTALPGQLGEDLAHPVDTSAVVLVPVHPGDLGEHPGVAQPARAYQIGRTGESWVERAGPVLAHTKMWWFGLTAPVTP